MQQKNILDTKKTSMPTAGNRFLWIDYMKIIGMYFIVYGHFFSIGNKYIYAFSVALFFVTSGFLTKEGTNTQTFWKKTWYNLIVPMLIISSILFLWKIQAETRKHTFCINELYEVPLKLACGFYSSLQIMWFVYTLVVLKIIHHYTHTKTRIILLVIMPIIGIIYNKFENNNSMAIQDREAIANAIVNTTIAYPFFFIGNYLSKWKRQINECNHKIIEFCLGILSICLLYLCGKYNSIVFIYINEYGRNFVLYIIGGFAGTVLIYVISKQLKQFNNKYIHYCPRKSFNNLLKLL